MCVNANEIFTIHTGTQPSTLSLLLLFQKEMHQTGCEFTSSAASLARSLPFPTNFNLAFLQTDFQKGTFLRGKVLQFKVINKRPNK